MEQENKATQDYYVIDLKRIFEVLWKKAWLIGLVALLVAAVGFSVAAFAIAPQYSSEIMLYVNNSSISLGDTNLSFSASEITAAQSLVKTYIVILNNRTTLEKVIDEADVPYTYEQLSKMIEASSVNDTEVMRITVTTGDPYEAAKIANCIAEVFPVRISEIIEGSSMVVVDSGVPNLQKVSPSIAKYTALGFLIGFVLTAGAITVLVVMDDTIHSEDYIVDTYKFPLLAVVPDLMETDSKGYAYYSHSDKKQRR